MFVAFGGVISLWTAGAEPVAQPGQGGGDDELGRFVHTTPLHYDDKVILLWVVAGVKKANWTRRDKRRHAGVIRPSVGGGRALLGVRGQSSAVEIEIIM